MGHDTGRPGFRRRGNMIPVTVIGGYLGAGKTTLINNLLRDNNGMRLAVLVNEFGELSIDEDLIESRDDDLISITGGCVCCSFGSDLLGALDTLTERGITPDHIIIESSGVAIPSAIAGSVFLMQGYSSDAVIVLADADRITKNARRAYIGDTVLRQLTDADLIVVTKCDLVDEARRESVMEFLRQTAPDAKILKAESGGQVPVTALLDPGSVHDYSATDETPMHADGLFESVTINPSPCGDINALAEKLTDEKLGVTRAKGFVTDTDGRQFLVQIVGNRREVTEIAADDKKQPALVVIGLKDEFDREKIASL